MAPKATTGPYIPRPLPQKPVQGAARPARPTGPVDIRKTKEYKSAARKWTGAMVGIPFVIITSWILYERIYGNKSVKKLPAPKQQPPSSS
ncbi:hypothetical protein N7448_002539 [Penicillium atrosanguineum]|uniref:Uncharacterized protein n=1 Tax=Penicillium atrosanguineum TaxID=1132637 RepID=A0A9W9HE08_9EURO|nr:uncharacterized protein N7443_005940 [Penicillium atrosanguineum]KAJ5128826.1 hypothetical protein N7526_006992 [Penicillium atrosanguineum]KAJ5145147.1 hypothetical protein N7448_002539 [Penicillium atrosanguineum]KAJ5300938.1 hypothetical protein N7443_005940 [Penicillium atrosanguineum]KAJ5311583.1 hypothetical protein N7476_007443 [Penicillium atrosanguineum]